MAKLKFKRGHTDAIQRVGVQDGQVLLDVDKGELYTDFGENTRIKITDTTKADKDDIYTKDEIDEKIEEIEERSDVTDVVGTYAELMDYDTEKLTNGDIIKVLVDETHNNAISYYRWLKNTEEWEFIGSQGPYATKDMALLQKSGYDLDDVIDIELGKIYQCTEIADAKNTTIQYNGEYEISFIEGYFYQYKGNSTYYLIDVQKLPEFPNTPLIVTSEWLNSTDPKDVSSTRIYQCKDTGYGFTEGYFYQVNHQTLEWEQLDVQDLSNYYTKSEIKSYVDEAVNPILQYITYSISNNTVTITGCDTSISGSYEIPMIIDGYPVTTIGLEAFDGRTGLTSITIPDSITSISRDAFNNCTGLMSITIPNSVTSIGVSVFNGCTALTSVTIPDSVTSIGGYAFYGCTGLISITISDSVTEIGSDAFTDCDSIQTIYYGGSQEQWEALANRPSVVSGGHIYYNQKPAIKQDIAWNEF